MLEGALLATARPTAEAEVSFLEGPAAGPGSTRRFGAAVHVVGMPELALGGLSETWLLKVCGHRHWLMLADAFGLPTPDFRDRAGERIYATFTAVRIADARLDAVAENDRLLLEGRLERVSRTQFRSRQRVRVGGRICAEIEMISVFLRRTVAGRNRSVVRAPPSVEGCVAPAADGDQELVASAYALRTGTWRHHAGFEREARASLRLHRLDPCPRADFNGAGFLYFASFQAFLDRAEWAWFREAAPVSQTRHREIFYFGNIELGETVRVELCGVRESADGSAHWCRVMREVDGSTIAEAFTRRSR